MKYLLLNGPNASFLKKCVYLCTRIAINRWNSIKDNIAVLWGMDSRSFTYTLFQLLTRPGYLVRDYISGRRQVSFPPVKMLVIVSLFTVIVETFFHQNSDVVPIQINFPRTR